MMKRLLVMVVFLVAAGTVHATPYEFVGGYTSNDWDDANNWVTLPSIYSLRSLGSPATLPPGTGDQIVLRDNVSATVNTGYSAFMGQTGSIPNGVGAVPYLDPNDPNNVDILWAEPASLVVNCDEFVQFPPKTSGLFIVGGVYGGEMTITGGSVCPDGYFYIGNGGNYAYSDHANATNVGKLHMTGGTMVAAYNGTSGTKTRGKVGYAGGNGTLILDAGVTLVSGAGRGIQWYIGEGTAADATNGATWGYMEFNGGSYAGTENVGVGYRGAKGKLLVKGGTMWPGGDLYIGQETHHNDPNWASGTLLSKGEVIVSGGSLLIDRLGMGWQNGLGTLTIKDTGEVYVQNADNGAGQDQENSIGRSCVYDGGAKSGNGVGVINVEGGSLDYKPNTSNATAGTIAFGYTRSDRSVGAKDPTFALAGVYSRGELNQTGGYVLFESHGTTISEVTPMDQVVWLGASYNNEPNNNASGLVTVTAGTFKTLSTTADVYLTLEPNQAPDPNNLIGTYTGYVSMVLGQNKDTTGVVTIGRNAYFSVDGSFVMGANGTMETGAKAKLAVDFENGKNARLNVTQTAVLADTLEVNSATGYRPREGDKMVVVRSTDPNAAYFVGDFSTITTNITLGPQGTLPFFAGSKNGGDYEVTFQGLTAGDCNGNHAVNTGDLALLGGNWMGSGKTWADGDFTGDGNVNTGDLALMGGNWMWSLPSPPEGASVPEPATLALLALGGAVLFRRRRR